jgi:hypothetical protein
MQKNSAHFHKKSSIEKLISLHLYIGTYIAVKRVGGSLSHFSGSASENVLS